MKNDVPLKLKVGETGARSPERKFSRQLLQQRRLTLTSPLYDTIRKNAIRQRTTLQAPS